MNVQEIREAWDASLEAAQVDTTFYDEFERLTDITQEMLLDYFMEWNKLSHDEAEDIARHHEVDLRENGFQAYLADSFAETT